jgi:hypothetical protein
MFSIDVTNADLVEITGPVTKYSVKMMTEVNGLMLNRHHPMHVLDPNDDLNVYFKITKDDHTETNPNLRTQYLNWLRRSIFFDDELDF